MKRFFKRHEHFFSMQHYINVLRRQPQQMKHVYAVIFAGAVTMCIAVVILYVDYGFWHETYSRADVVESIDSQMAADSNDSAVTVVSPGAMIGDFFRQASDKIKTIDVTIPKNLLEGKENYTRDVQVVE